VRRLFVQLNADLIHALELDVAHVIPLTSSGDVNVTVTLIDARHCPGSVMFLFDGYFGRILYTGDFRYEEGMLDQGSLSELKSNPVDVLYIDNTYCSPKCVFPSREEAKRQIINIIEQHPNERVVFGLRGLGKEDILISLAKWFDVRITVSEKRYRLLEVLALHEQFVVASVGCELTRFEVTELVEVTRSSVDAWSKTAPTIVILLTGLFVGLGYQPFTASSDIFVVPLSDQSPYSELHEFTARIRPKSVVPIVRTDPGTGDDPLAASLLDRTNVECFAEHLDQRPMQNYHIPPSVLDMMNHTRKARKQTRKQTSSRRKSVFATSSAISTSGQLSPNSSVLSSTSSVISDTAVSTLHNKSDCVWWKRMDTCDTVRSGIIRKPRVAVQPMKRCLPTDRCLPSRFFKQPHHRSINFPASFELRRKTFSMNEMLEQERKRLPFSASGDNSHVPSMATQLNVLPAADAFYLKRSGETCEGHPDVSVITTYSNVACDLGSTVHHAHSAPVSSDTESVNCAGDLWQLSENPIATVLQIAEPHVSTGGTIVNSVACHQEGSEYIKETNALSCVLPSVMVSNHCATHMRTLVAQNEECALNLTTDMIQLDADATTATASGESLPCNQTLHADEAKQSTAVETDAGTQPLVSNQVYHLTVESESLKLSQYHDTSSYNIVSPMNTVSINRSEEMSADRERHPTIQLKVGVSLDNHCETAVIARDKDIDNAAVTVHIGLPGVVDASSNHSRNVLPVSGVEREIGTHYWLKGNAVTKSTLFSYKQDELRCNVRSTPSAQVVSLPPKKKWRKQFRATQMVRSHQENRQKSVDEYQKLSAKLPFIASELGRTHHDGIRLGSSISSVNVCPRSSLCTVAKRVPLLTNCSQAAADITCRCAACKVRHWSARAVPHVTGSVHNNVSDCVLRRTSSSGSDKANQTKEQLIYSMPMSSKWDHRAVGTLPLDLSVGRKSGHYDCRFAKDAPRTVSDAALFR